MAHDTARSLPRSLQEELPAHGRWLQKLARSLVRDEASADDLVQEAQLAALCSSPSLRGALGPFLARVTRNLARRGWRDAARRAQRERAAARPEALPGADETAARLEIQRVLVDELAALAPPVRHALVRRYLDGWAATRIARETGDPAATVRWRLQRGLAELRRRLDRQSGGDGIQWRLALLPVCQQASPWTTLGELLRPLAGAGTIQGALTMKAMTQALIAGALVTAVGAGAWWRMSREEATRDMRPSEAASARAEREERPVSLVEPTPLSLPARESVVASPTSAEATRPADEARSRAAGIRGRCVDEDLTPIGSARVSQAGKHGPAVPVGVDGVFAIEATADSRDVCTLRVEAASFATRFLEARLPAEGAANLGDVILMPGGTIHGRVFGPNGAAFAGAAVTVTAPDLWGSLEEAFVEGPPGMRQHLTGVTGEDGRFEIVGVEVGPMRVWAGARGMRHAVSPPIEVRARERTDEVELHLEPVRRDDRITGVVLSPEGEPVPEAGVSGTERSAGNMTSFAVAADAHGRFEIAAKSNHVYDLEVSDREDRWADLELAGVAPGTHGLGLRFHEARWIEVRVRTRDGAVLEDYEAAADGEAERTHRLLGRGAGPHPGGRTRLRVPNGAFYVRVDARGYAPAEEGPLPSDEAPSELDFELEPEPGLRGRVLAGGRPLAGALVALHSADPRTRIEHQGYPSLCEPRPCDRTTTDAEGRFTLRVRSAGTFVVRAEAAGHAPADTGRLALDSRAGRGDLELALGRGGILAGRVLVAPGHDPAGVIVALNRGDAFARTLRSDAEGLFRIEGLTPGPWHLSRGTQEVTPKGAGTSFSPAKTPVVIPFNCTIHEGETTWQDLDLRAWEPCVLDGVLLVNGLAVEDWGVTAWPGAKEAMVGTPPATATATDGSFALTLDEPGPLRLSFSPPAELGGQGRIDALLELRPGIHAWREDFAMGRLSGRCPAPVAAEHALFYNTAAGVTPSCWLPILPDGDGRYVLPYVPAGAGAIKRLSQEGEGWSWTTLLETEIPARGERVLDVP